MRHASRGRDFNAQRSLRRQRDAVLGRLAVNQVLACMSGLTRGVLIGNFRAQAVALFSHHETAARHEFLAAANVRKLQPERR